jgi:hypothetical protein
VERGGRFDARRAAVLLWSAGQLAEDAHPIGAVYIRWHTPTEEQATIYLLEWDESAGGSEAEVRRALDVLRGAP